MKKSVRILWKIFIYSWSALLLFILLVYIGVFGKLPSLEDLENPSASLASEVYASDGTLMGKYYIKDGSNVDYKDISPNIINALISTEDERFYDHSGIDGKSLLRAALSFGTQGGGSTITQQLAKTLLVQGSGNPIIRVIEKVKEWIVAVKLERNFTKEEIIALYLNFVPYSENIYGIRNASRTFFQKEPDRVSIEEAAMLIGMINAPTRYNPLKYPEAAFGRRNLVLSRMVSNGKLSREEENKLRDIPINTSKFRKLDENTGFAPYLRDVMREDLIKWCKENKRSSGKAYNLYSDGLRIYTTINPQMQIYAEEAVAEHLGALQKNYFSVKKNKDGSVWKGHENIVERAMKTSERWKNGKENGMTDDDLRKSFNEKVKMKVFAWNLKREKDTIMSPLDSIKYARMMIQSAFMAMDPVTGEVKAWVGGINFKTYKLDHANKKNRRQPGSTFKPILYTLAIENGYSPDQELPAGPIDLGGKIITGEGGPMYVCLAKSLNPGAAYLMNQFGVNATIDFAKKVGIEAELPPYPSIALGAGELSLYEMMQAYTMFPGGGFTASPYYITRIEDRNGNVLANFSPKRKQVISEATSYTMCMMMGGAAKFGTAHRLPGILGRSVEMGCKTGTTTENVDCWFLGYTPQLLAGSWVGCDDPFLKMQGDGARIAMPVWGYFFRKVLNDRKLGYDPNARFSKPSNIDLLIPDNYNASDSLIIDTVNNETAEDFGLMPNEFEKVPAESEAALKPETSNVKKPADNIPNPKDDKNKKEIPKAVMPPKDDKAKKPVPKPGG